MNYKIGVLLVYIPPEGSNYCSDVNNIYDELLLHVYTMTSWDQVIIMGDFNSRIGDMSDSCENDVITKRSSVDPVVNGHGKELIQFLIESRCCVVNGRVGTNDFTLESSHGRSVVDYFLVRHGDLGSVVDFSVLDCAALVTDGSKIGDKSRLPDHKALKLEINYSEGIQLLQDKSLGHPKIGTSKVYRVIPDGYMCSDRAKNVIDKIVTNLQMEYHRKDRINELYDEVVELIDSEIKGNKIEKRSCRRKNTPNRPYWNSELSKLWRKVNESSKNLNKLKKFGATNKNLRTAKSMLCESLDIFDKLHRKIKRQYQRGRMIQLDKLNSDDPKCFWEHINRLGPKKCGVPWRIDLENGETIVDRQEIMETWSTAFENLYKNEGVYDENFLKYKINERDKLLDSVTDMGSDEMDLDLPISLDEVRQAIRHAKTNKAVGIDNIANEALKDKTVIGLLHKFFSAIFESGHTPDLWRKSIIHPIPKGSIKFVRPMTFRGLALQSCIYKLYSGIINARLVRFLDIKELLSDTQNGFRKNRSCNQHLFALKEIMDLCLAEGKSTHLCFVDFSKAFDFLDRNLFLSRLVEMGVRGKLYTAIKNSYDTTINAVRINGELGRWFETKNGSKQGDVQSPTHFSIYVNSLIEALTESKIGVQILDKLVTVLAYADDLVLISPTQAGLQQLLNILERWCNRWRLKVNPDKTKIMHVRPASVPCTKYNYTYNQMELDKVSNYRYLGFILNEHGLVNVGCDTLAGASLRVLGSLITEIQKNGDVGLVTFKRLYTACVVLVLDYCGGIWGINRKDQRKLKQIDNVQYRAQRFFLGINQQTCLAGLQGDMPLDKSYDRRILYGVRFYNQLLRLPEDRLVVKIYKASRHFGRGCWAYQIKSHLVELGFEAEWREQLLVSLERLKDKLLDRSITNWKSEVLSKPKLRTYRTFQQVPSFANHVTSHISKSQRSLITRLRLGTLPICLEQGRYTNTPAEDRVCEVCSDNIVEDEFHLMFECTAYKEERKYWLDQMDPAESFDRCKIGESFTCVFNKPYYLAKFLKTVMDKRAKLIKTIATSPNLTKT